MKKYLLLISVCIALLGCTHGNKPNFTIIAVDSFELADNGRIASSFNIFAENDSVLEIQNIPNQIYRVDLLKKQIVNILDSLTFDIDSLIAATYQKRNIRSIIYSKHTEKELKNFDKSLFQTYSPVRDNNKIYLPIAITAEARYLSAEAVRGAFTNNMDSLISGYGATNITSIDFLNFLLITDLNFKVIGIKPLYPLDKKQNLYLMPVKDCYIYNDIFYCPVIASGMKGMGFDSVSIENNEPPYYFNTFNVNAPDNSKNIISSDIVNGKQISVQSNIVDEIKYCQYKSRIISGFGNQLFDLSNNKLFEFQPDFSENENIEDFTFIDHFICIIIAKRVKLPLSDPKRMYGITTQIGERYIKIVDITDGSEVIRYPINKDCVNRFYKDHLFTMSSGEKKAPVIHTYKIDIAK